ncbi:Retrovirus-related Pol polyprotein from transposon RE1 [Vitis vinifera]|uniref:Retrovirus-related Pol polyprotein from transposon RE1 n=1 Tax=Vitis vinifera TaxID=29760 RepID=A0A438CZE9_VITVI|nr:Retrovirus-related Pol polyprotein from transposon RE1 [Vitis vinifera]
MRITWLPPEADIPEVDRVQWRKIDAQLCSVLWQSVDPRILLHLQAYKTCFKFWTQAKGLYTNDIQRLYKVASAIVHLSQQDLDLSTYIGQIASLKEEFLTVMPLTPDVGAQQTQLDKFFMVLTLIGLRPNLESIRDQILGSSSVPSLDDVFARLLRISSTQTLPSDSASDSSVLVSQTTSRGGRSGTRGRANVLIAPIAINLATLAIVAISYMEDLLALPIWPSPLILRYLSLRAPPHLRHLRLLLPLSQPGNASACLTHTSSLGPWILDSGASDHLSGPEYGKTIGIGRESQGLYHLTSDSSPAVCISTNAPLLIHNRLGHPSLSKFQKMVPRFPLCRRFRLNARIDILLRQLVLSSSISHVPFRFWGDAILTACYLINRMPSSVLHDQIPHSLLFPDQPLYFLPPRVFGCTCFVHILTPGQDKLSAKAMNFAHSIVSPPDAMPPRPLQVYHRRPRVVAPLPFPEALADSLPIPSASPAPALPSPNDLPIAVRKGWRQAMVDEMAALHSNGTLDLVVLPSVYGSDYGDTFSPVAKIASVRLLLSMAAMCSWPLYQLDIKNAFLHGDLAEEVYMEQPPGFVAQGEFGLVCRLRRSLYGLKQSPRAWFSRFSSVVQEFACFAVQQTIQFFIIITPWGSTKDLGKLKYFLGIEIAQSSFWCGPFPKEVCFRHPGRNRQFLQSPCDSHWDAVIRILRYIKSTPGQGVLYENRGHTQVVGYTDADWAGSPTDRRSTSGYCVFIGGNLISWKSKKQDVVARSSAEAEYRAMALATCELIWLRHLLQELRFGKDEQMKLICDNQAALHIASNPVFHERTKHIEVDCHFIREKIALGCVATSFVNSNDQLADIFTKSLRGPRIKYICNNLGAYDVYAPT